MDNLEAIKLIRTWLRPSNPVVIVTADGFYLHNCKRQSIADRFVEAITLLGGTIIKQETISLSLITLASLPLSAIAPVTPGAWGGSKPGRTYKSEAKVDRKLDVRLTDKHIQLLEALALKWYGPRANSKTIRRLIKEAAEKEGITAH